MRKSKRHSSSKNISESQKLLLDFESPINNVLQNMCIRTEHMHVYGAQNKSLNTIKKGQFISTFLCDTHSCIIIPRELSSLTHNFTTYFSIFFQRPTIDILSKSKQLPGNNTHMEHSITVKRVKIIHQHCYTYSNFILSTLPIN